MIAASVATVLASFAGGSQASAQRGGCRPDGCVRTAEVSGLIDPIIAHYISRTVADAASVPDTRAVMLIVNSPGTVLDDAAFNRLAVTLASSAVPVTVWVGPAGAQARGGAAELVALVTDFGDSSAAPGSVVGEMGHQRSDGSRFGQVASGRRAPLSTTALEAQQALDLGVIDRIAPTGPSHLIGISGVTSVDAQKDGVTVKQPKTVVVSSKLPLASQLMHSVASPAVTYLLLAVGLGLFVFEFFTAGVGVAGVIGAVAVLGAGYGLGVLPVRVWAVALCVVAAVAFSFDVAVGVPRLWTAVGMGLWVIGSFALFDGVPRPWMALVVGILGMAVAMISGMPAMVRSRFGTPTIGREHLIGYVAVATTTVSPEGTVEIEGAAWHAITNRLTPLAAGDEARVVAVDGLTLEVEPLVGGARDYRELRGARKPQ